MTGNGNGSSDSRQYKRLVFKTRLKAILTVEGRNRDVIVKDFSKSGMGVFCDLKLAIPTIVKITLEGLPYDALEGRVVWCGPSTNDVGAPKELPFRLGIDFMPRDDAARENQLAIYNHLKEIAGETTAG